MFCPPCGAITRPHTAIQHAKNFPHKDFKDKYLDHVTFIRGFPSQNHRKGGNPGEQMRKPDCHGWMSFRVERQRRHPFHNDMDVFQVVCLFNSNTFSFCHMNLFGDFWDVFLWLLTFRRLPSYHKNGWCSVLIACLHSGTICPMQFSPSHLIFYLTSPYQPCFQIFSFVFL